MTRYFAEAEAEMQTSAQYYEDRQSGLGDNFLNAVEAAIKTIERSPRRWPIVRGAIRRYLVPKYPFGVIYTIYRDEIIVIAFAHLSRDPSYWFGRLRG